MICFNFMERMKTTETSVCRDDIKFQFSVQCSDILSAKYTVISRCVLLIYFADNSIIIPRTCTLYLILEVFYWFGGRI